MVKTNHLTRLDIIQLYSNMLVKQQSKNLKKKKS